MGAWLKMYLEAFGSWLLELNEVGIIKEAKGVIRDGIILLASLHLKARNLLILTVVNFPLFSQNGIGFTSQLTVSSTNNFDSIINRKHNLYIKEDGVILSKL